ncbi:Trp biosynthesis-associated membrane protein [Jatrophihabitans sp. GAS493]|uniref:Trp biosynthesis-associated membrane protein n=1 Tax=Jatrophihabitans sp. GAS493 TaxID=1907575 RepID=UPI000BB88F7E|nr:Trp biosynthesis-associated membrane protein [Jatrophihabitans sp. GAS493]
MTTSAKPAGSYRELAVVLLLLALGGATALLAAGRVWRSITVSRPRPLSDDVLLASGHSLQPATSGLAVVALAATIALLATGARVRQLIGALLVVVGAALVWQGIVGLRPITSGHGLALVKAAHSGVGVGVDASVQVVTHAVWPLLVVVAGALVILAAIVVVVRAPRWTTMSRRYEAPKDLSGTSLTADADAAAEGAPPVAEEGQLSPAARDLALWKSLDRGEDPTA